MLRWNPYQRGAAMSYSLYLIYTIAYSVLLLYGTRLLRLQFHASTALLLIVTFIVDPGIWTLKTAEIKS